MSRAADRTTTGVETASERRPFRPFTLPVQIDIGAKSHPGLVRENNEDQFFVTRMSRSLETLRSSLPSGDVPDRADEVNYVFVVADGMGGHAAGEVASRLAISSLVHLSLEIGDWHFTLAGGTTAEVERRARTLVQQVGAMIRERGSEDATLRGMGSTLTAARSLGRDLMIVHVGDSRAYLFRAGRVHRLTKDHTFAQMLVDSGRLDAGDVASSGVSHILTNALGGSTEHVEVDVDLIRLESGDRLVLCSDGLTDLVEDDEIAGTLASTPAAEAACDRLIQQALDRGGRDNVTVVVAGYTFPDTTS